MKQQYNQIAAVINGEVREPVLTIIEKNITINSLRNIYRKINRPIDNQLYDVGDNIEFIITK